MAAADYTCIVGATPRSVPDSSCAAQPWAQLATH